MICAVIYGLSSGFGIAYMLEKVIPPLFEETAERIDTPTLFLLASLIPLAFLARGLSGFFNTYLINVVGLNILKDLRKELFDKLQQLQLAFYKKSPSGELLSRLSADTTMVQQTLTTVANDIIKQPAVLVFALGFIVYASIVNREMIFVLASISVIPLCVLPVRYFGKRLLKRARQQQDMVGDLTDVMAENISGVREVRAFSLQDQQSKKFSERVMTLLTTQLKVVKYYHILSPTIEIVTSVGVALAFVFAYQKGVSLSTFMTLMPVLYFSYDSIKRIGNIYNQIQAGTGALERLEEILYEPVTITDPETPRTVKTPQGAVAFQEVSFQYGEEPVLRDVSIDIPAGSTVAIVGPSGAGKSTFISLIPRFYEANSGEITIDGVSIKAMTQTHLRSMMAVVPQDSFLFRDTLLSNIRLGRPDATDEEVYAAARHAHIHDFIETLPRGYQTMAGERGSQLSGGQRQRIALARAFLRDAPILILDEATSSLDSESELKIQEALEELVKDKTVFIVAHRFSTIRQANLILLFEAGRIVAQGDLQSLMKNPTFKRLYENQLIL